MSCQFPLLSHHHQSTMQSGSSKSWENYTEDNCICYGTTGEFDTGCLDTEAPLAISNPFPPEFREKMLLHKLKSVKWQPKTDEG